LFSADASGIVATVALPCVCDGDDDTGGDCAQAAVPEAMKMQTLNIVSIRE
jgi:hypothetical protein